MSACVIERELGDVSMALSRAKAECVKFRSTWEGDEAAGHYVLRTPLGTVRGTYSVAAKQIRFAIESKPRIVPCVLIARVLDEFLKG